MMKTPQINKTPQSPSTDIEDRPKVTAVTIKVKATSPAERKRLLRENPKALVDLSGVDITLTFEFPPILIAEKVRLEYPSGQCYPANGGLYEGVLETNELTFSDVATDKLKFCAAFVNVYVDGELYTSDVSYNSGFIPTVSLSSSKEDTTQGASVKEAQLIQ